MQSPAKSRAVRTPGDYPNRDDEKWHKHSLAWRQPDGSPRLDYKPVTITTWKPVERKY